MKELSCDLPKRLIRGKGREKPTDSGDGDGSIARRRRVFFFLCPTTEKRSA